MMMDLNAYRDQVNAGATMVYSARTIDAFDTKTTEKK